MRWYCTCPGMYRQLTDVKRRWSRSEVRKSVAARIDFADELGDHFGGLGRVRERRAVARTRENL